MAITRCVNCNKYLGVITEADILCKCNHYNIVRPGKKTKLVLKEFYNQKNTMATVPKKT